LLPSEENSIILKVNVWGCDGGGFMLNWEKTKWDWRESWPSGGSQKLDVQ